MKDRILPAMKVVRGTVHFPNFRETMNGRRDVPLIPSTDTPDIDQEKDSRALRCLRFVEEPR